jgi:hypothetical protein
LEEDGGDGSKPATLATSEWSFADCSCTQATKTTLVYTTTPANSKLKYINSELGIWLHLSIYFGNAAISTRKCSNMHRYYFQNCSDAGISQETVQFPQDRYEKKSSNGS